MVRRQHVGIANPIPQINGLSLSTGAKQKQQSHGSAHHVGGFNNGSQNMGTQQQRVHQGVLVNPSDPGIPVLGSGSSNASKKATIIKPILSKKAKIKHYFKGLGK